MKGNDLWMCESGDVSYKETAPDSFVQRRHKLYSANWVNFRNSQWNDIGMTRNDLGMNESDVVSLEETAPDSFTPTSFGPFSSHSASSVSFEGKIDINLHWMTPKWTRMTSECTNRVLSLIKRQHPIHSFRPHSGAFLRHSDTPAPVQKPNPSRCFKGCGRMTEMNGNDLRMYESGVVS